jgi:hypothetical protein
VVDIAALPYFTAKGNYRGIVPDTLDVGYRVDEFRPWGEVTLSPMVASAGNALEADTPELRLTMLTTPVTVLLVPTVARIETGVLRFARAEAPPAEAVPPTLEEIQEQQLAEGVPLLAMGPALELGTRKLVYRVGFGPLTILGRNYTFGSFYFEAPVVSPATTDAEIDLTTVARFTPAP